MFAKFKSLFSIAPTFPLLDTLEEVTNRLLTSLSCLDNMVKTSATPCFTTYGNLQSSDVSAAMNAVKSAYVRQAEVHCGVLTTAQRIPSVYEAIRELHAGFQPERKANGIYLDQCDQMERDIATAHKELGEMKAANVPEAHIALLEKRIEELQKRHRDTEEKLREMAPSYETNFGEIQRNLLRQLSGPLIETAVAAMTTSDCLVEMGHEFEEAVAKINTNPPTEPIVEGLERLLGVIDSELEKLEQDETYYGDLFLTDVA